MRRTPSSLKRPASLKRPPAAAAANGKKKTTKVNGESAPLVRSTPTSSLGSPRARVTVASKDAPARALAAPHLAATMAKVVTKPLAIKEDFKLGDKVVYPAHGVGVVDAVQVRSISGSEQKFYMITIVETGMKIMVPVSQAQTVGLRRVVDSKTIEKVYDILRDRKVTIDTQTWNRRYREYTQKIKTGSVFEIAKVIRDLSVLKSDKELSFGERKMLDTAQGLLVKEISIAKSRSEDTVKAELEELF